MDASRIAPEPVDVRPGRRPLRRALAGSLAASVAIQALNALTGVLLARTLGPDGRGALAAILLWPGLLVALGSFGLTDGIAYHAARATVPLRKLIGTAALFLVVQSVAIVGVGALVLPMLLHHYGSSAMRLGVLYLAYVPLFLVVAFTMSALQGLHRFAAFQTLRVSLIVVVAATLAALAMTGGLRAATAVYVYLSAYGTLAAVSVVVVWRLRAGRPSFDRALARDLGRYALLSHSSNVSSLLNERLDQFVISAFLAPAQLGLYVVAVTLTSLTNLIGQSVSMIALPVVARVPPGEERTAAVRRYVGLTIAGAVLLTIPMVVVAPMLVRLFFGSAFSPAATVARVLLVAAAVLTTTRLLQSLLKAVGRPLDAGISEFMALGVTVAALAALVPWLGILGAGIASLLAYTASAVWTVPRAATKLGFASPRDLLTGAEIARWSTSATHAEGTAP